MILWSMCLGECSVLVERASLALVVWWTIDQRLFSFLVVPLALSISDSVVASSSEALIMWIETFFVLLVFIFLNKGDVGSIFVCFCRFLLRFRFCCEITMVVCPPFDVGFVFSPQILLLCNVVDEF